MILADSSVWVDHLHRADPVLYRLFHSDEILIHPVVIGELALGRIADRAETLKVLRRLPRAEVAGHDEVLQLIEDWKLYDCGIGYGDAHLLASVLLTSGSRLWTRDRALRRVARQLAVDAGLS
ncbi:MAG TPA: type II toxin-antitoxin system VapC family toxin [Acidobacteriaceae bacterium]|nr:type II toxin-antitoxin system VapC family toxin [Acidobacteriaceae bacterium]